MEVVGEYEYSKKDLIGHGAFAVVFKGRIRKKPDSTVAIKSITKKNIAKSQNLLSKEIKILKELSDLHHDNVVALMDCKETQNHVYLVMEYCNGGDLADYLQVKGTLSEDTISQFLKQIAAAMRALNAKGIVHRDLKPQNILLCYPAGQKNPPATRIRLKIADFGFARFLQDGVMAATLCGSPMYMAPEVIMSIQYDAKADLWSIGTIVFQCLTGKAPFQAQTPQQLKQFYEKNAELKPNIPQGTSAELKDLLYRLLKRNAKDRIEFETFFCHPFLQPPSPAASSSPVPVPGRSPSFSSDSPASLKAVSASPLSGKMEYSPPVNTPPRNIVKPHSPKHEKIASPPKVKNSPPDAGGFIKLENEPGSRCSTPTEDFVMVPAELQSDQSDGSDKATKGSVDDITDSPPASINPVTVSPTSGAAVFKKDSSSNTLNANRPTTLPVTTPTTSPPAMSEPIPVPTQVQAYQRMRCNSSPSSPLASDKAVGSGGAEQGTKDPEKKGLEPVFVRQGSENRLSGPDIGSLSPPVQFSIGTPPGSGGPWRRTSLTNSPGKHGTTSPYNTSPCPSPLKRSNTTPTHLSPLQNAPSSLPTILGSPSHTPGPFQFPSVNRNLNPAIPSSVPNLHQRTSTVPENMAAKGYNGNMVPVTSAPGEVVEYNRADTTDPILVAKTEGTSMLSQQLFRAAFGGTSPHQGQLGGTVIPFAGNYGTKRERQNSEDSDKSGSLERNRSAGYFRHTETSPPPSLMYAQSPPNMEGPITFVAPPLAEETLMDDNHNETMAKLNFILDLVENIIEVSSARGTPLNVFSESLTCKQGEGLPAEQVPRFTETQRRLEQLILHVRSLHLLSSALQLARDEIKQGRLQISNSLKTVIRQMNTHYHKCVTVSRHLQQRLGASIQAALTPQIVVATADKLIYNYAIEMCQTAALDELFGNPQECFRRYQTAQILLHSLAQQANNIKDKDALNKYKEAVERRLSNLQTNVHNYMYDQQVS